MRYVTQKEYGKMSKNLMTHTLRLALLVLYEELKIIVGYLLLCRKISKNLYLY